MTIAVVPNLTKRDAQYHTTRLIRKLKELHAEILMDSELEEHFRNLGVRFESDFDRMIESCDTVIAVGGDGTIIHCARHAALAGKPILGVNVGRVGFVAGLETDEYDLLESLVNGSFRVEKRMMLDVHIQKNGKQKTYCAFNDAVISKGTLSHMPYFRVRFNDTKVCEYRADGLILSTPTGSTAYALSAGGPVIDPQLNCILLTPICPQSLMTRPVVFGPDAKLTVQVEMQPGEEVFLTMDGENSVKIDHEAIKMDFSRSENTVKIIKLKNDNFYEIVNDKLGEGRIGI